MLEVLDGAGGCTGPATAETLRRKILKSSLRTEGLSDPLADQSIVLAGARGGGRPLTCRDAVTFVLDAEYQSGVTYGDLIVKQDLRYAGHWGYARWLMALEVGIDADPAGHGFLVFHHALNIIRVEEARDTVRLTPYQKTVLLPATCTHDLVEGVVDDIPHGEKTQEFRDRETTERQAMLGRAWKGRFRDGYIADVDAVIGHDVADRPDLEVVHDCLEVSHALPQFCASMDAGRMCFWILEDPEQRLELTPLGKREDPLGELGMLAGLAIEVSRNTAAELAKYQKRFWIAYDTLLGNARLLERIKTELPRKLGKLGVLL